VQVLRTLVTGLWLAALFLVGLLIFYLPAFHHPTPSHIKIAVAASPADAARLQHEVDEVMPGGYILRAAADAAAARSAVLNLSATAAYVPDRHHPLLYGAKADGAMGNGIDSLRSIDYFGNNQLLRPTTVLCAWIVAGAALILLGQLRQRRTEQEAAEQPMTEPVPEPFEESPAVDVPEPIALTPHQHHLGDEEPTLTGRVTDSLGQPLPDAAVTVTDLRGRQLVRARTDRNGEYAATGFGDDVAVVLATMPGRQSAVAQVLLSSSAPVNQDFTLDAPRRCRYRSGSSTVSWRSTTGTTRT
jgi:hypothetical protein